MSEVSMELVEDASRLLRQVAKVLAKGDFASRLQEELQGLAAFLLDLPPSQRASEVEQLVEDVLVKHEEVPADARPFLRDTFVKEFAPLLDDSRCDELDLLAFVDRFDEIIHEQSIPSKRTHNAGERDRLCFLLCPALIWADLQQLSRIQPTTAYVPGTEAASILIGIGTLYTRFGTT